MRKVPRPLSIGCGKTNDGAICKADHAILPVLKISEPSPNFFSIMLFELNLLEKNVLILGGARIETNYLDHCLRENAIVTIVCPKSELPKKLLNSVSDGNFAWFNRKAKTSDVEGKSLVLDFTSNVDIVLACQRLGITYFEPSRTECAIHSSATKYNLSVSVQAPKRASYLNSIMSDYMASKIPAYFADAAKRFEQLALAIEEVAADKSTQDEFLAYIAETWYLNSIAKLSNAQIEKLVEHFKAGVLNASFEHVDRKVERVSSISNISLLSENQPSTLIESASESSDLDVKDLIQLNDISKAVKYALPDKVDWVSTAVEDIVYDYSDIVFVYPQFTKDYFGQHLVQLSQLKSQNSNGYTPKVIRNLSVPDAFSGETIRGSLLGGSKVSVTIGSQGLSKLLPSMIEISKQKLNPVFHTQVTKVLPDLTLAFDNAPIYAVKDSGFVIYSTDGSQDVVDSSFFVHQIASKLNVPVLHSFDGSSVMKREPIKSLSRKSSKVLDSIGKSIEGATIVEKIVSLAQNLSNALHTDFLPYSYTGSSTATHIIVSLGYGAVQFKQAVQSLENDGFKAGYLQIKLYRPWSSEHLKSLVPPTASNIIVINDGSDDLLQDIQCTFVGAKVSISSATFGRGVENVHPDAIVHYLKKTLSGNYQGKIVLDSNERSTFKDLAAVEAVFWDNKTEGTVNLLDKLEKDVISSFGPCLQTTINHLSTSVVAGTFSEVRFSKRQNVYSHRIDQADVLMCNDLSIASSANFVAALRFGGVLFVKTALSHNEIVGALSDSVKAELVKKQIKLYTLDAELIARNYTIFYGKYQDYLATILLAVFYRLAFNKSDCDVLIATLFKRIATESANSNIAYTKKEAINTALSSLQLLGVCTVNPQESFTSDQTLPLFACPTVPSEVTFTPEEIIEGQELKSISSSNALLPLIFPSRFRVKDSFRPDVPDAFSVKVTENIRLTPESYDRNVFHMELDISNTGLKYDIGDALGVYSQNDGAEVAQFLKEYGSNPHELIFVERTDSDGKIVAEVRTIEQLLIHSLDIFGKPGKKFYQYLATVATDDNDKEAIAALLASNEVFDRYVEDYTPTYADLLLKFKSARPNLNLLIRMIPQMKPRHYSIASSQRVHPNSVHLLIVVVDWKTKDNFQRFGQATRYLVNSKVGNRITVSVKPSVMKLPESLEAPVIMSGLGTGMAPFRAFIEERWYWKQQGKKVGDMVLYFGSRNRANEYLYGEELDAYNIDGVLSHLRLAFSRDQKEKVYIQHKIQEDAAMLHDLLVKKTGAFYLCGPTWPVPDVTAALLKSFGQSMDEKESLEYLEELKSSDRFILEVMSFLIQVY